MSLIIGENFNYQGQKPNFVRDTFTTLEEMKNFPESSLDEGHLSLCLETQLRYDFYTTRTIDPLTGKWRRIVDNSLDANSENPISNKALSQTLDESGSLINEQIKKVAEALKELIDDTNKNIVENELTTSAALNEFRTTLENASKVISAALNDLETSKVSGDVTINGHELNEKEIILNKSDIGLGEVDNTSDRNKIVSGPQQEALNKKVDKLVGHTLIGTDELKKLNDLPDRVSLDLSLNTITDNLNNHTTNTSNPHKVTANQLGLGGWVGKTPENLPVSGPQQEELNKKVDKTIKINTYPLIEDINLTKSDIGLSMVNNTSDEDKEISKPQKAEFDKIYGIMYKQHSYVSLSNNSLSIVEKGIPNDITVSWNYIFNGVVETPELMKLEITTEGVTEEVVNSTTIKTYTKSITNTSTFKVTSVNLGITKSDSLTVSAYYPKYYGGLSKATLEGESDVTGLEKQPITSGASGSYSFSVEEGNYAWFCIPSGMKITKITSGGFEVPLEAPVIIEVSGKGSYSCYRSTKAFKKGLFECVIK